MASKSADYVLGHADAELARLSTQARVVDPITRRMLVDAGIETGMRVLDVGSGAGDVAWLIAEVVGSGGEVVGCDRAEVAVATARRRAVERGLANVSFLKGDPGTLDFQRPFDAVVGRYVLMFQADPAVLLRGVARAVRRGGLIAFHEPEWRGVRSVPVAPSYDRLCAWMVETFIRSGADPHMGDHLGPAFVAAGLPEPTMRSESLVGAGATATDLIGLKVDLARTMVPAMEKHRVVSAAEVDIDTAAERIRSEVAAAHSVVIGRAEVAAWARIA
jgi:SAM-dependent methyltransferase